MSGELKFPSRLSKKEGDTAAPDGKEILHWSKKEAKKTFLQLAKKGIIHLSKRSTSSHLANTTILGQYKMPYTKLAVSQATRMTIRLSKKQMGAFQQANREFIRNGEKMILKTLKKRFMFQQKISDVHKMKSEYRHLLIRNQN